VGHIVCLDLPNQEIYLEGNTDVQYSVGWLLYIASHPLFKMLSSF
jgi:hypothetical protein